MSARSNHQDTCPDDVCNGSTVEYTYKVTNKSDFFTWTGSLSDSVLGSIDDTVTLTPGAFEEFTASGTITGAVTNIATASGTFDDPVAPVSASDTASATVTGMSARSKSPRHLPRPMSAMAPPSSTPTR